MIEVEYREIKNYPGYRVGSNGEIQSLYENGWYSLSPILDNHGYYVINLCNENDRRTCRIHRLVLETFKGPCPPGMIARHLDGNRLNNNLCNLVWGTHKENCADRIKHGTQARGERTNNTSLNESDVKEIRRLYEETSLTQKEIAVQFDISQSTVARIVNYEVWKHI